MRLIGTPLFLMAFTSVILADKLRGKVVSIADGDALTVLDADKKQHKVCLTGIDKAQKKQAFGAKTKARLGKLVAGNKLPQAFGDAPPLGRMRVEKSPPKKNPKISQNPSRNK
jgi:endonuclease YncB( thermonuclease family)